MPYGEPDSTDPEMRVGVGLACSEQDLREMAVALAGEMAQVGHDAARILDIFRQPFYSGPHLAWRSLGESSVRDIVEESVAFWSCFRVRVDDAEPARPAAPKLLWPGRD